MSLSVALAKWYLNLRPVTPGDYYLNRKPLQRAQMEYDDEVERGFHWFFNGRLKLEGRDVLDLGCGYGGRTVRYREAGATRVVGMEVGVRMVQEARQFAAQRGVAAEFVLGCGECLPFADASFDAICSYDVFEHVENLEACLRECMRVLRPRGILYAVFPPFYYPFGGSHLHVHTSKSPAPNLLFSGAVLKQAVEQIQAERPYRIPLDPWRPSDKLWTLNGTTIHSFESVMRKLPHAWAQIEYLPLLSKRHTMLYPLVRLGTQLPLLREVCSDRIVAEIAR
jgi:SAM-dependent methyltransferase